MKIQGKSYQISINVPTLAFLEAEVKQRFKAGQGFAMATMNVDHLVKLGRDAEFARAYAQHDLVTADGNPVVWLSALAKDPVDLITGSDQVLPMTRWAAECGATLALVGSTDEVLQSAATELERIVPGAKVVCRISPPFGFDPVGPEAEDILQTIAASGAQLCFIALGAPKQERFAAFGRSKAPRVGFASIGASLDFIAGTQTRAPKWVRAIAMEWLWRLLTNPKRLAKRYLDCAVVLPGHAVRAVSGRK